MFLASGLGWSSNRPLPTFPTSKVLCLDLREQTELWSPESGPKKDSQFESLKAFSLAGSSSPGLPKRYSVLCGLFTLFGIIEKNVRCSEYLMFVVFDVRSLILGLFIVETIDSIVLNHSVFGLKRSTSFQRSFVRATRELSFWDYSKTSSCPTWWYRIIRFC